MKAELEARLREINAQRSALLAQLDTLKQEADTLSLKLGEAFQRGNVVSWPVRGRGGALRYARIDTVRVLYGVPQYSITPIRADGTLGQVTHAPWGAKLTLVAETHETGRIYHAPKGQP